MKQKSIRRLWWAHMGVAPGGEIITKESLTEEQLEEKNKKIEKVVELLIGCFSLEELNFLKNDSREFKNILLENYLEKFPSLMSDDEIKKRTEVIFRGFRNLLDENAKDFLRCFLIRGFEKIILISENSYIFDKKMTINIPLLYCDSSEFKKCENYLNRVIIWYVFLMNFNVMKLWKIEGDIGMTDQMLARYHRSFFEVNLIRIIRVLVQVRKPNRKDKYKFFTDLDRLLFPDGSYVSKLSSFDRWNIRSRANYEFNHGLFAAKRAFWVIILVIIFFIVAWIISLVIKIERF